MILLALSLLLGPIASPTPNPLAPAIAVYPDCAKTRDDARTLACDYGVRLLSREPRKATVLFVAMWSTARFGQAVRTSPDGLHIAPDLSAPPPQPPVDPEPIPLEPNPMSLATAPVAVVIDGGIVYRQVANRHQREMDRKVWVALLHSVYERGNDDYSRAMLPALAAIDWNSPDSVDRFVAAHEAALAADAAKAAPVQPTPPTRP